MTTSTTTTRSLTEPTSTDSDHVNEVCLRGRVAAAPEERELPSGDRLVSARLIVARPPGPARQRQPVDVLDCVAWTPKMRRMLTGWEPGAVVEIRGAIRRRFRRGPVGLTSRVEIAVASARRVRAAPQRAGVKTSAGRRRA
ncbi:MAG TPA: single-stranded DNA-binding protein [Nocardioidaceae bacterium]|jgi:single-strand DNA-binding protein|nr:single-stranded DNA-binding protein [Nocardioidaceae bacterium]